MQFSPFRGNANEMEETSPSGGLLRREKKEESVLGR